MGYKGSEVVTLKGETMPPAALLKLCDIQVITPDVITACAAEADEAFISKNHLIDVLAKKTQTPEAQAFVDSLRGLQGRLYSIASSPKAHPGEVHLTVGAVRYELNGRAREGVCSTFLADRIQPGGSSGVYVAPTKHFLLPENPEVPVIMVGPGTGIAPFRAFLEERKARGDSGENWLFFGDQHEASDFIYKEEIEAYQADGTLNRLELA